MYEFKPSCSLIASCFSYSEEQIMNEPMLYGASVVYAQEHGGVITNDVLHSCLRNIDYEELRDQAFKGYHPVIDTKVVLLMPGQYPCIPGWHCDGVIRKARGEQPNLDTLNEGVYHYIFSASASGSHCGTDIKSIPSSISKSLIDQDNVWRSVNKSIEECDPEYETTINCGLYKISRSTLHRGTAAKERQWRFFFRMSYYHMPAMNEHRKQVQVYTDVNNGW